MEFRPSARTSAVGRVSRAPNGEDVVHRGLMVVPGRLSHHGAGEEEERDNSPFDMRADEHSFTTPLWRALVSVFSLSPFAHPCPAGQL